MQVPASTANASGPECRIVQENANVSSFLAGSLLDGKGSEPEVRARLQPLLSVRQVAKLLAVCPATVYRMCELGELPHFRVRNAIRVPVVAVKAYLGRARRIRSPH